MSRARTTLLITGMLASLAACQSGPEDNASTETGATETETGTSETGTSETGATEAELDELYACVESEFMPSPLAGPGYDPELGLVEPIADSYIAHTTQFMLQPGQEVTDEFDAHVEAIVGQLMATEGVIAFSLVYEPTCNFYRTVGIWRDVEAMGAFVVSGAHSEAMTRNEVLRLTGRSTHWDMTPDEVDEAWTHALEQIDTIDPVHGGY